MACGQIIPSLDEVALLKLVRNLFIVLQIMHITVLEHVNSQHV
jgi:hypothetical protein